MYLLGEVLISKKCSDRLYTMVGSKWNRNFVVDVR